MIASTSDAENSAASRPWRGETLRDPSGRAIGFVLYDANGHEVDAADHVDLIVEAVNALDVLRREVNSAWERIDREGAVIDAARALVTDAVCDCDEAYTGRGMHAHDCLWRWADDYDLHALVRALDGEVE